MNPDLILALLPHLDVILAFFVGVFVGVTLDLVALPRAVDWYVAFVRHGR